MNKRNDINKLQDRLSLIAMSLTLEKTYSPYSWQNNKYKIFEKDDLNKWSIIKGSLQVIEAFVIGMEYKFNELNEGSGL